MRVHLTGALLVIATTASAQTTRVSGRVIEEGRGTPVANATVRITGAAASVTDSAGRFQFRDVLPGRYIFTLAAIGYRFRTVELTVSRDTSLTIEMSRRVTTLDTMVVRPKAARVVITAVDSATGDFLLQAQATLYPGGRFIGSKRRGTLAFDSVPAGPVTIIVEAPSTCPCGSSWTSCGTRAST